MSTHAAIAAALLAAAAAAAEEPATRPDDPVARREAALIEQLASPDAAGREEAAYWLTYHRTERAFDAMFRVATSDPSESLRENAENWLRYRAECPTDLLVKEAKAPKAAVRRLAVHAIRTYQDPKGRQALLRALDDADAGVRLAALAELQFDDQPESLPRLIRLMNSDVDPTVRDDATYQVQRRIGELPRDVLVQMLANPDADARRDAAKALGDAAFEPPAALLAALADPSEWVRKAAVEAVGRCKRTAVQIDALLALLHDASPDVAEKAAEGLVGMKDAAVDAKLAALLAGKDLPAAVRYAIDRARAKRIGGVEGARLYLQLLRQCNPEGNGKLRWELGDLAKADNGVLLELVEALADPDVEVREAVIWAMWLAGNATMIPHLRRVVVEDPSAHVRDEALSALLILRGDIGFPVAPDPIEDAYEDLDAAVRALRLTGDPRAADSILAAVDSPRADVRLQAIGALGYVKDPRALEALRGVLLCKMQDQRTLEEAEDTFWWHPLIEDARGKARRDAVLPVAEAQLSRHGSQVVWSLWAVKDAASEAVILHALADESLPEDTRAEAARALGEWKHAPAVPALIATLSPAQRLEREGDGWLAMEAIGALAAIRDRRAVPALTELLSARDWRGGTVRMACRAALWIDAEAAVRRFLTAFGRYPEAAREAMRAAVDSDEVDFGFDAAKWRQYWAENREELLHTWKNRCDLLW